MGGEGRGGVYSLKCRIIPLATVQKLDDRGDTYTSIVITGIIASIVVHFKLPRFHFLQRKQSSHYKHTHTLSVGFCVPRLTTKVRKL